jgi:hypothetical protein
LKGVHTETIENAVHIIRWFNGHLLALGLLRETQVAQDGKTLALLEPCITRWTSHSHAANRLSDLKGAVQTCWKKYQNELKRAGGKSPEQVRATETVSRLVDDKKFWYNLSL